MYTFCWNILALPLATQALFRAEMADFSFKLTPRNSRRNFCFSLSQSKNSAFILITFFREMSAPQYSPWDTAARPFGCSREKDLKLPSRCHQNCSFQILIHRMFHSQNNFSETCFPKRLLILKFYIRNYLLIKRLTS